MAAKSIDNRRDILLLLLYAPGLGEAVNEPIVGRTRLMKMLFLFKEEALQHFRRGTEITEENFYEFFPWNFGPFSRQVYDDLTFFTLRGFIETLETSEDTLPESAAEWEAWVKSSKGGTEEEGIVDYREQALRLTERGEDFAEGLFSSLTGAQKRLLREFKARLSGTPLRALLRYVYEKYPDQTKESEIKERVLGER